MVILDRRELYSDNSYTSQIVFSYTSQVEIKPNMAPSYIVIRYRLHVFVPKLSNILLYPRLFPS